MADLKSCPHCGGKLGLDDYNLAPNLQRIVDTAQTAAYWDAVNDRLVIPTAPDPRDEVIRGLAEAGNQARLAFAGYVSEQSAVDKLDAALAAAKGEA